MINNFVDFMTNTIRPEVINDYLDNEGSLDDFLGSDDSTLDYTKAGWVIKCYLDMKDKNLVDEDVTDIATQIINHKSQDGVFNYEYLSPSGFTFLQMCANEAKRYEPASFEGVREVFPTFDEFVEDYGQMGRSVGQQTFGHSLVEISNPDLVEDSGPLVAGVQRDGDTVNKLISPYYLALKRAAQEIGAGAQGDNYDTFMEVYKKVPQNESYENMYGEDPRLTGSDQYPTNELTKFLLSASHETIKTAALEMKEYMLVALSSSEITSISSALKNSVESAGGTTPAKSKFDLSMYLSGIDNIVYNLGYSPLMFYVSKYRTDVDINVLNALRSVYHPLAISISGSSTEGFNAAGLIAYQLELDGFNGWKREDIASFLKSSIEMVISDSGDSYATFVASGTVALFTNGSSNNAFGPVNNILVKINDLHSEWWSSASDGATPDDFESTYINIANSAIPTIFDFSFYKVWMYENGREIS